MTNLTAALGLAQMERLPGLPMRRKVLPPFMVKRFRQPYSVSSRRKVFQAFLALFVAKTSVKSTV